PNSAAIFRAGTPARLAARIAPSRRWRSRVFIGDQYRSYFRSCLTPGEASRSRPQGALSLESSNQTLSGRWEATARSCPGRPIGRRRSRDVPANDELEQFILELLRNTMPSQGFGLGEREFEGAVPGRRLEMRPQSGLLEQA